MLIFLLTLLWWFVRSMLLKAVIWQFCIRMYLNNQHCIFSSIFNFIGILAAWNRLNTTLDLYKMGEILHGRVGLEGLIVTRLAVWPICRTFTRVLPATPVTLFGPPAASSGKKADKRLQFWIRRWGHRAESSTGISNQSNNNTLHRGWTCFCLNSSSQRHLERQKSL